MVHLNINLSEEEVDAITIQLCSRLDHLKKQTTNSTDFTRITELVNFIKPIQSA